MGIKDEESVVSFFFNSCWDRKSNLKPFHYKSLIIRPKLRPCSVEVIGCSFVCVFIFLSFSHFICSSILNVSDKQKGVNNWEKKGLWCGWRQQRGACWECMWTQWFEVCGCITYKWIQLKINNWWKQALYVVYMRSQSYMKCKSPEISSELRETWFHWHYIDVLTLIRVQDHIIIQMCTNCN